jgi:hypothetical protein
MADTKVTALTALTTPQPSDELLIVDNSGAPISKRITRQYLLGYIEYVALVSQAGVNAPTAVDIKNDTGATVTFSYNGVGSYTVTFSLPVLTANKTIAILQAVIAARQYATSVVDTSTVHINTASSTGAAADGTLGDSPLIVRIYV